MRKGLLLLMLATSCWAQLPTTTMSPAGTGSGDVATDAIWDASGDLAIGSGADTAARLAVGASGLALVADPLASAKLAWTWNQATGCTIAPTSTTLRTVFPGAEAARPCNYLSRAATEATYTFVQPSAITLSGATAAGTIRVYVTSAGGLVYGLSTGFDAAQVAPSGDITEATTIDAWPAGSIPIWSMTVAGSAFTGDLDMRAAGYSTVYSAGTGMIFSGNSAAVNTTVIGRKFYGAGVPGAVAGSSLGDTYSDTTADAMYVCLDESSTCGSVAANEWVLVGPSASSGNTVTTYNIADCTGHPCTVTWTKPASVNWVRVKVWGSGAGGSGGGAAVGGGGGSGGGYAERLCAVTGNVTVTIGIAGAGGSAEGNSGAGQASSFGTCVSTTAAAATAYLAVPGKPGIDAIEDPNSKAGLWQYNTAGICLFADCADWTLIGLPLSLSPGGISGYSATNPRKGGRGGGGGGQGCRNAADCSAIAGSTSTDLGGAGGAGGYVVGAANQACVAGTVPGGGGGGGASNTSAGAAGCAGAAGRVQIFY